MRPLFTVHAGEFLVGDRIERAFPSLNVWISAKDTGVDPLITDHSGQKTVSLQVKLSRDYKKPIQPASQGSILRATDRPPALNSTVRLLTLKLRHVANLGRSERS